MFETVDLGPGARARFTTAAGGVSTGPYASLNLGVAVGDDPEAVATNRGRVAESLGAPLAFAAQVHSNVVLRLGEKDLAAVSSPNPPTAIGEGDAMITSTPGLGLAVQVADCVPVLLADPEAGLVGVSHAGRAGVAWQVITHTVQEMWAEGAKSIRAAIGPSICGKCYEVDAKSHADTIAVAPAAATQTRWGTLGLDLPAAVRAELKALGVEVVSQSARCTFEHADLYSHRRATKTGQATGRFAGVIALI